MRDKVISLTGGPEIFTPEVMEMLDKNRKECGLEPIIWDRLTSFLREGEPCTHPGCLKHVTHPCEGCGRVGGRSMTSGER